MRIFRWTFAFIGLVRGRLWGAMLGYWLGLMADMLLSQYFFRPKAKQRQHTVTHYSPTVTDDYQVLGISPNATDEEVRQAYRILALKHHPDRVANKGEVAKEKAERTFRQITEAKERIFKARGLK